ncbi:hypothetical protein GCM10025771_38420 [Niveibacterium umoris]|uniref:Tetratricopeptide (TPR) repeat protein n=1 Tax=Niveibacterium umoris TaxID=1193620 RepID=A0A840BJ68_9RHOO|nr:tetratricopeptide repeat protein [Niveibacterium umoris]MBB4010956.1 tetratricopeptide (TPR) repeat protein [Niveibacterium umoris]
MKAILALLFAALLSACASKPVVQETPILRDALFAPPTTRVDSDAVFALSSDMRSYLAGPAAPILAGKGPRAGLVEALYHQDQLKLRYDSSLTRTAAEAFASRSGNCLSLVIMTGAFAREVGLAVRYQRYTADPALGRSGSLQLSIDHVNLTLDTHHPDPTLQNRPVDPMTIDFLPPEDLRGLRMQPISERTVMAMFMNNRAAETLAEGQVDNAYWWARAAIQTDPDFASAYNTLGVVYRRHGNPDAAELAFNATLQREPGNTLAMSNLADALAALGRKEESQALLQRLASIDPEPPFHYFDRGMAAMQAGDYAGARDLFAHEVKRAPDYHEFHFWLGLALYHLGDLPMAQQQITLAEENSTTGNDRTRYAAKLAHLRSLQSR